MQDQQAEWFATAVAVASPGSPSPFTAAPTEANPQTAGVATTTIMSFRTPPAQKEDSPTPFAFTVPPAAAAPHTVPPGSTFTPNPFLLPDSSDGFVSASAEMHTERRQEEGNPSSRLLYTGSPVLYHLPLQSQHPPHLQRHHYQQLHGSGGAGTCTPWYPSSSSYHPPTPDFNSAYPFPDPPMPPPRTAVVGGRNDRIRCARGENDGGGFLMIDSFVSSASASANHATMTPGDRAHASSSASSSPADDVRGTSDSIVGEAVYPYHQYRQQRQPAQRPPMEDVAGHGGRNVHGPPMMFSPATTNTYTPFLPPAGLSFPTATATPSATTGYQHQPPSDGLLTYTPGTGVFSYSGGRSGNGDDDGDDDDDNMDMLYGADGGGSLVPAAATAAAAGGRSADRPRPHPRRWWSASPPPAPLPPPPASPPPPPPQVKRGRKRGEAKPGPNFLTKLYAILNDPAYHHMLHWADDGVQIIIRKPKEMEARLLPLIYKQSKFQSFSRQLNIYGFMRKVSMRHADMAQDSDVSVWTHYELNRFSSVDKLMSYKRRVGPRNYARKSDSGGATPSSTKTLFPLSGQGTDGRFGSVTAPSASMSPQRAAMMAITTPCHVLALGSPYSISTGTTSDRSLPDTPASVSPARPIRTNSKSHKMTGTLPMPSSQAGSSAGFLYPTNHSSGVPQPSIMSSHLLFTPSDGSSSLQSIGNEGAAVSPKAMGMAHGGLWQSLLGNAGDEPRNDPRQSAKPSPCLFPSLDPVRDPSARAPSQPSVTQSILQAEESPRQLGMKMPIMHEMQHVRPFAPQAAQQMMFQGGQLAPSAASSQPILQPTHLPSRTLSNSSVFSSNMLMTPRRPGTIQTESEYVEQSPVFASFDLSLGHSTNANRVGGETSAGGPPQMRQVKQEAEDDNNLATAGNQAFATFLHDMVSSPPSSGVVQMFTEIRPTPVALVQTDLENSSTPQPIKETTTQDTYVNSFETVKPQTLKPSASEMEVVIADIDQMRDDTTGKDECKVEGRNTDGQLFDGQDAGAEARQHDGHSFTNKTVKQVYDGDSTAGMFAAWVVAQDMDDGHGSGRSEYQRQG